VEAELAGMQPHYAFLDLSSFAKRSPACERCSIRVCLVRFPVITFSECAVVLHGRSSRSEVDIPVFDVRSAGKVRSESESETYQGLCDCCFGSPLSANDSLSCLRKFKNDLEYCAS